MAWMKIVLHFYYFVSSKKLLLSHPMQLKVGREREEWISDFQVISSHKNSYEKKIICWDRQMLLRTYKWEKLFYWKHQRDLIDLSNFNNNIRVTFQKNQIFCWFIPFDVMCVWNINLICHPWKHSSCEINSYSITHWAASIV